jgi:competence protein comEA helix-hairpin-helix repeat region
MGIHIFTINIRFYRHEYSLLQAYIFFFALLSIYSLPIFIFISFSIGSLALSFSTVRESVTYSIRLLKNKVSKSHQFMKGALMYPYYSEHPEKQESYHEEKEFDGKYFSDYSKEFREEEELSCFWKRYLERGKVLLLLILLSVSAFFFLAVKDRESEVLYEGRAGEEQTYTQKEEFSEGKESRSMEEMERRKKERERDSQQEIERATEEANKADEKEIADEKKVNKEETVEEEKVNKEEIEKPKSDKRNISTKININTANAKELESLKGIGPATAKNIISYREEYGGFSTIEEIMNVKRIGEKTFLKIQDFITVE